MSTDAFTRTLLQSHTHTHAHSEHARIATKNTYKSTKNTLTHAHTHKNIHHLKATLENL